MPSRWTIASSASFQPWFSKSAGVLPRVLDESVAVLVAESIDPSERGLDRRPDRLDERKISRALVVRAREHHEQRRAVDAAVVLAERNLADRRQLTRACFVQNLARLGIPLRDDRRRLRVREVIEHAAGQLGPHPQTLQRRDDPVAAERCVEPGQAGVRIRAEARVVVSICTSAIACADP